MIKAAWLRCAENLTHFFTLLFCARARLLPFLPLFAMAALSPHLATPLPFLPALRPPPRRLPPAAFAASVVPPRGARIGLRGFRHPDPLARNWFEDAIRLRPQHQKTALFASQTDSPNTGGSKQSGVSDNNSSSSEGPPVLTILAGIIVFLLVFWVIGSIFTWIVGLVFGGARS